MRIPLKVREAIYERDGGYCPHCGETEAIGLQHRAGKGMGGSKLLDIPGNLLTFCNLGNAAMESDPIAAEKARKYGWKIGRYVEPTEAPVYDMATGDWFLLDNEYGRTNFFDQECSI